MAGIGSLVRRRRHGPPGSVGLVLALVLAAGCHPVGVFEGTTTVADVAATPSEGSPVNILGIGTEREDGRIVLRTTGASVPRGSTVTVGVMGPGMMEGTGFAIVGVGFATRLVRFAMTEGGGVPSMPAAVLAIDVPATAPPGLYSIIAFRELDYSIFSGGLEVH
jgi:hypothetical protein